MDGLEGAVAQAASESAAIKRNGSAGFEHPFLGIGSFRLGFEFGIAGFRRLSSNARLAPSRKDRCGSNDHRDDEEKSDAAGHLFAPVNRPGFAGGRLS